MESIVACRSQISDRFPVASFAIRLQPSRYYEVACATDPRLFHARFKRERTRANFFSSRERGLLQAPRGDTAFMLPPEQLQRFAGSRRVFYALASYGSPRGDDAHFTVSPTTLDSVPSITLASDFTGRTLDRARIGHPRSSSEYGGERVELVWGGDQALEAEARRAQAEGGEAPYDDGHDPSLWDHGQAVSAAPDGVVDPTSDADRLSADAPVALAVAAESGAQCDDAVLDPPAGGQSYGYYGGSVGQERDDEESGQSVGGLSAAIENDANDQEDTAYGGYEDGAAAHSAMYGDGDSDSEDTALALEEMGAEDAGDSAADSLYGSAAAPVDEIGTDSPELSGAMEISGRDPGYSFEEELGESEAFDAVNALAVRTLDIPEKVRLLRVIARAESGREGYSAINPDNEYNNPKHPAFHRYHIGLSFGFVQFTQRSGLLGKVLTAARSRSLTTAGKDEQFEALFGPDWQALLDVTNAPTAEARVAPVGGATLWERAWTDRFQRAGRVEYVRAAQNEIAIRECMDPVLSVAAWLGFTTSRALSMLVDRVIHMGMGGGLTWVLASCGPLNAEGDWRRALAAVGAADLSTFQRTKPALTVDGKFGPRTHAALIGALRALGASSPITIAGRDAMLRRLVAAAAGHGFATRLTALYENRVDFDDAISYDLSER
jgi:hypothetical protein